MTRSYLHGHLIIFVDNEWLYADTRTPTIDEVRPCGYCSKQDTKDGHDGCLGTLSGPVMNACCGHGEDSQAYIQYWDGRRIAGNDAVVEQIKLITQV